MSLRARSSRLTGLTDSVATLNDIYLPETGNRVLFGKVVRLRVNFRDVVELPLETIDRVLTSRRSTFVLSSGYRGCYVRAQPVRSDGKCAFSSSCPLGSTRNRYPFGLMKL
jgi:hypothetical protein